MRVPGRLVPLVLVAATATGLAACGGGDDRSQYLDTYRDACGRIADARAAFASFAQQAAADGRPTKQQLVTSYRTRAGRLYDVLDAEIPKLRPLDAPQEFVAFQREVAANSPGLLRDVAAARRTAAAVTSFRDLQQVGGRVGPLVIANPPRALTAEAPRCTALSGGTGSSAGSSTTRTTTTSGATITSGATTTSGTASTSEGQ